MSYGPMINEGGGTIVTEVELGALGAVVDIAVGNYAYIDLTPPETGYIPVGWCISAVLSMINGKLMNLNGLFRYQNGGWRFILGNVGTEDCTRLWYTIKILWVKE